MSQFGHCDQSKRARYTDLLEHVPEHVPDVMGTDLQEAQGFRKGAQDSVRGQRGHITVMICSVFILF